MCAHLPVLGLGSPVSVGLGELALSMHSSDGCTELSHGVEGGGEVVHHLHHVLREGSSTGPVTRDGSYL